MNGRKIYWPLRAHAGRLERDQRAHLHSRPSRATTTAGPHRATPGWSYADVLPYFKKLEHNVRGESEWHGADGPLWVSDIRAQHELVEALIAARWRARHSAQRRFQRRAPGRRRLLPAHDAERLPLFDRGRLPSARARPRQSARRNRRAGNEDPARRPPRARRRLPARRPRRHRHRAARGHRRSRSAANRRSCCSFPGSALLSCSNRSPFLSCTHCRASARTCRITCRRGSSSAARSRSRPTTR